MNSNALSILTRVSLATSLLLACASCSTTETTAPERRDLATIKQEQAAATPAQVLDWLRRGNERFASG